MSSRWTKVVGGLVLVLVVVVSFVVVRAALQPDEPSSFYEPPESLAGMAPGDVIRSEDVDVDDDSEVVTRVLYTSTGDDGAPIAVSGVVITPQGDPPPGGWPVVAWAHGTTGVVSPCAPSLEHDAGLAKIPELARILAAGNVVVVTDYPGLGTPDPHPYLVGQSEGRAVLDSVRAAHRILGDGASPVTAIYGHSQGGHATLFASAIAADYAPELQVVGAAPMAPPTELGTLLSDDKSEALGIVLTSYSMWSWSELFPDLDESLVVDEAAAPIVADIAHQCVVTTAQAVTTLPDVAALEVGFLAADPSTVPSWNARLTENSTGDAPLTVPVLVAQGLADTLVRPTVTQDWVTQQCARGVPIDYRGYTGESHFGVRDAAAPAVVDWLLDRVAGKPAPTGCSTEVVPKA